MKKMVFLLSLLLLTSCTHQPLAKSSEVVIVVANDLHYAHETVIGNHSKSHELSQKADGKQINYLDVIVDAFIEEMKILKPDVIILNGDLVFNGERINHLKLSKRLKTLDSMVLVNPGNHDIESPNSIQIKEDVSRRIPSVSEKEFKKIYDSFGYKQAKSQDYFSLSYLVEVSHDLDILMLDSHILGENNGHIKKETLHWITNNLSKEKETIVAVHHNVLNHSSRLTKGFTLDNHAELLEVLKPFNVHLTLSGHIHLQSIVQNQEITDIATSSLAVYKNNYGIIKFNPNQSIEYQLKSTDVSQFAINRGFDNPELLDFEKTSLESMTNSNFRRTAFRLFDDYFMDDEENLLNLASLDAKTKAFYFSGQLYARKDEIYNDEFFDQLKELYPSEIKRIQESIDLFGNYDQTSIRIPLK